MLTRDLYSIYLKHHVVTTDSRNCPPDSIFFALKGEKFDGNDYIEQALKNGAAFAVGDQHGLPEDKRIIRVENALKSLQELANFHRKQLDTKVIAITGTNGKTTTKELVAAALSTEFKVLYTQGNLNNHIGVPLTLLQIKPFHRFAVIEMGANHPGEIHELCKIADPDYGLITNVGKAHLEGFGSFEGVVRTKTELYDYLREKNGLVFVNFDDSILREKSKNLNVVYYGTTPEAFIQGRIVESESYLNMEWRISPFSHLEIDCGKNRGKWFRINTQLVGNYNFENVLAAICLWMYLNDDDRNISSVLNKAIADYLPTNNRSQSLKTQRNHLIIDAYNANPSSMQVALNNLLSMKVSPKMVIIGEMKELGEYSREEHQKLVDRLRHSNVDKVILCGESFAEVISIPDEWKVFQNTRNLLDYLKSEKISGYNILIKGSRTNQLEMTKGEL